jgi:hypothetical protein
VDYLILGVLGTALLVGWVRGLVGVLTGFVVFLVATVVAGQYTGAVVAFLNRSWDFQGKLAGLFERQLKLPAEAYKVQLGSIPWQKAQEWLQSVPIPDSYRQTLAHRLADWSVGAGNQTAADYVIHQLAAGVLNTVVFLVFVTVLGSVLGVIGGLLNDRVKELPLVGTTNSLLGALVIGFEAAVLISLAVGLVAPVLSMYGFESLTRALASAKLTPYGISFYAWLRGILFGLTKGAFFAS